MLEKELKYYYDHLDEWLNDKVGMFVLIKYQELIGFYPKIEEAISAGASLYGKESFLVKRIQKDKEIINIPALSLGILNAGI